MQGSENGAHRGARVPGRIAAGPLATTPSRLRWAGVAVLSALVLALLHFALHHRDPYWAMDLEIYHFAGDLARSGENPHTTEHDSGLKFTMPPFAVLLVIPFSLLSLGALEALLLVGSALSLLGALWYSLALLGVADLRRRALLVLLGGLATVWLDPVADTLRLGQINLVLVLLVFADLARDGRRGQGVLIGLAAGIKLMPGIFVLLLLATGRVRAAMTAVATFLGTILASLLLLPGVTWSFWTDVFFDNDRYGFPQSAFSQSLRSALARLTQTTSGLEVPWLLGSVAVVALATWVAVHAGRRGQPLLAAMAVGLAGVLVSPIAWDHHWVWVVLPGFLLLARAALARERTAAGRGALLALLASLATVFVVRPFDWVPHGPEEELSLSGMDQLYANSYVLVGLAALAVAAVSVLRRPALPAPSAADRAGARATGASDEAS